MTQEYILTLACPDRVGIVHAISGLLAEASCNIEDSAQHADRDTGMFFMRTHFSGGAVERSELEKRIGVVAQHLAMQWQLHDAHHRPRVLLMASRIGHCLNDLLYRYSSGLLAADVRGVVSNHPDFEALTRAHNLPFYHLPVANENRAVQEARLLSLIGSESIELVVLARYMQVLSPSLCRTLAGRCINIHHSFLPSFKGAKPYAQAHARGVKLIGATAHFVTEDLDEGPIIEQDVARVDHGYSAEQMTAAGRDVESVVLSRAVTWFVQRRVLLNGNKTIVFR
ncbi:MAG: formyltetrahydrofolate deformylase [Burkholderiaceae bacterium]|jgi:formyltetrahydrofolate deformylase